MNKVKEIIYREPTYKERNLTKRERLSLQNESKRRASNSQLQSAQNNSLVFIPTKSELKSVIRCEENIERAKLKLCKREDFNIFEIYKMYFDRDSKGYINVDDIKYALQQFGVEDEMIRTKYIELIFNRYVNTVHTKDRYSMKYSDYWNMILPKDKEFADLAINRMPVYTSYCDQNNDLDKRNHKELKGYTHQLLINMMKEMFETMIVNFKELSAEVNSKGEICNTSRTLVEVENNY